MSEKRRLTALSDRVLQCRSMGHAWEHVTDFDHFHDLRSREVTRFVRQEQCLRCDAVREKEIDLSHPYVIEVRTVRMRYPDGYLIKGSSHRVTRGEALGAQYGREVWL